MSYLRVSFRVTLSNLEWLGEIFNDTKHRAASLRQLSFLSLNAAMFQKVKKHHYKETLQSVLTVRVITVWPKEQLYQWTLAINVAWWHIMTEKTAIAGGSAQKKFKGAWPPSFLFISADIRYAGGGCRILFRKGHWHGSPKNITSWSWKNHLYGAKKTHTDIVWKYHHYHHLVHSSLYISSNFCLKIQNSVCGLQSQRNGPQ